MPQLLLRRWIALALVAAWLAPGAAALAVSVHVVVDHGHEYAEGSSPPSAPAADHLALGLAHGHHHATAEPEHEHRATMDRAPGLVCPTYAVAPGLSTARLTSPSPANARIDAAPRRAPPEPLFLAHRSLLL